VRIAIRKHHDIPHEADRVAVAMESMFLAMEARA
jgi:hypothetical protein